MRPSRSHCSSCHSGCTSSTCTRQHTWIVVERGRAATQTTAMRAFDVPAASRSPHVFGVVESTVTALRHRHTNDGVEDTNGPVTPTRRHAAQARQARSPGEKARQLSNNKMNTAAGTSLQRPTRGARARRRQRPVAEQVSSGRATTRSSQGTDVSPRTNIYSIRMLNTATRRESRCCCSNWPQRHCRTMARECVRKRQGTHDATNDRRTHYNTRSHEKQQQRKRQAGLLVRDRPRSPCDGRKARVGMARSAVVTAVEAAVREEMDKNDASHDFSHIERVRNMALTLAREEVSG